MNILLLDSGSGGVNVLKECVKVCPYGNYLLFCDTQNLPYGNKTSAELFKITAENLEKIRSLFKFDIAILACNTLSATILDDLRKSYKNITFIGTEPAILPAIRKFDAQDILVLATEKTIENSRLIRKYQPLGLKTLALPTLATLIDENIGNLASLEEFVKNNIPQTKAIVLGCTHYASIKFLLQKIYPETTIFDGANGVARRLLQVMKDNDFANEKSSYQVQFYCDRAEDLPKFIYAFEN